MSTFRVLVVEDDDDWRDDLEEVMARLDRVGLQEEDSVVHTAENLQQAQQRVVDDAYDLAVVDLSLLRPVNQPAKAGQGEEGFELLTLMRRGTLNRYCAVLVVTGTADTGEKYEKAYRRLGVKNLVVKSELHLAEGGDERLLALARAAILETRLERTAAREQSRHHLTLTFDLDGWVEGELVGPAGTARGSVSAANSFQGEDWVERADAIDGLLLNGQGGWRQEAAALGSEIYQSFATTAEVHDKWIAAEPLTPNRGDLWLRFRGPREGLGIPFDLMRDDKDFLCFHHLLTREIVHQGFAPAREPFWKLVQRLHEEGRSFRGLLVAANADGTIPDAEKEVEQVAEEMEANLLRLGLRPDLKILVGDEAQHGEVKSELESRRYHLFHYAGHGRHADDLPEVSGLVLPEGGEIRSLTASDLGFLAADSELQVVFLSCCLSAVSKSDPGQGDFYGVFDALHQANVPTLLGYRWTVDDEAARLFASTFYAHLWRTLSPAEAAFEARQEAAMGKWGRNDETWAAPVVLMQGR